IAAATSAARDEVVECQTAPPADARRQHRNDDRRGHQPMAMRRKPELNAPGTRATIETPMRAVIAGKRRAEVVRTMWNLEHVRLLPFIADRGEPAVGVGGRDLVADDRLDRRPTDVELARGVLGSPDD